jgi:hypothetical protein
LGIGCELSLTSSGFFPSFLGQREPQLTGGLPLGPPSASGLIWVDNSELALPVSTDLAWSIICLLASGLLIAGPWSMLSLVDLGAEKTEVDAMTDKQNIKINIFILLLLKELN